MLSFAQSSRLFYLLAPITRKWSAQVLLIARCILQKLQSFAMYELRTTLMLPVRPLGFYVMLPERKFTCLLRATLNIAMEFSYWFENWDWKQTII